MKKLKKKLGLSWACLMFASVASAGQNAAPSSHFVFDDNFEGDISNLKGKIDLSKFTFFSNKKMRGIFKEGFVISSNNKFSFKLNKKIKFSDINIQSKISLDELQYSNDLFKRFFPGYEKDVKFENNSITIDYLSLIHI